MPGADRRRLRLAAWGLGGVLLGVGLLVLLLNVVARTERGHEFVLEQTLAAIAGGIPRGELTIERISGNLFEGANVYGVRLVDDRGRVFLAADSGYIDYRVTTLLSPRIHIQSAVLHDPEVYVFRLPGDTLWNYEAIFADTTTRDPATRVERATIVDRLRIRGGMARVQLPWVPDSTLGAAAQRREVADALSDTSQILVDEVEGGYLRTMNFTEMNGRLSGIRFAPGSETGSLIRIDSLRTMAQIFREPAELVHAEGRIALLVGHIEVDAPLVRLPNSELAVRGVVRSARFPEWFDPAEAPMYDLTFESEAVRLRDLQWLYPYFPDEGGGAMVLDIEHRPGGLMFLFQGARIAAPGTRIAGSFGLIMGDTLRFVEVDVEADPVDVGVVESMLPEGLPVVGLRLGGVEVRGNGSAEEPASP
jgi:hypothetical protein